MTFLGHIRELQGRLFAILFVFVLLAAAAFPFFDKIVNLLVAPLGKEHELVYLTPSGAFGFMMQVCIYVGIIGALPVIVYHIYRFIMPAVQKVKLAKILLYVGSSFLLAVAGIVFAYIVSLPAALYFLTGFNLYHINPMLTIDSYFSFVMTYLLAGAILFQLPLIMMIINNVKPLKPKDLMSHQGKVIVASFVVAAIISPTPDALNQTLLACPVVVMYQFGIMMIAVKNRKRGVAKKAAQATESYVGQKPVKARGVPSPTSPVRLAQARVPHQPTLPVANQPVAAAVARRRSIDGFVSSAARPAASRVVVPARPAMTPQRAVSVGRSVDGFVPYTQKGLVFNTRMS